jgi:hypothetical protein
VCVVAGLIEGTYDNTTDPDTTGLSYRGGAEREGGAIVGEDQGHNAAEVEVEVVMEAVEITFSKFPKSTIAYSIGGYA